MSIGGDSADIIIRVKSDGIATADAQLKRLMETGVKVETVTAKMENGFRKTSKEASGLKVALDGVHTVMTLVTLSSYAGMLITLSDQWTNLTNKLVNANNAHENLSVVQDRVFDIAQRTRTSLEATGTLYARMVRSLEQYNVTAFQTGQLTEVINKAMIVSGATTAESTAAIIQFSQALQSGVLSGDEFRSVMEQAPRLGKMIADGMEVGTKGLRALAKQQKLTSDEVIRAISKASGTIEGEFNRTVPTFSQNLAIATNNAIRFAGTTQAITGGVGAAGATIVTLSENLDTLSNVALGVTAIFAGRMLTATIASSVATLQLNAVTAQTSVVNIRLIDSITRTAAARYQSAQATLAQVAAERTAIQTAYAADKQYYKGISTLSALLQNTGHVRAATEAAAAAQTVLAARLGLAATASRVLTVSLTAMNTVMGILGGPLGLIMLAASGWYMYNQNVKQTLEDSKRLAMEQENLENKLRSLTKVQQEALQVQLQRASATIVDQIKKETYTLNELNQRYATSNNIMAKSKEGTWSYNNALAARNELEQEIKLKQGAIVDLEQKNAEVKENLTTVTSNLAAITDGLTGALQRQNGQLSINVSQTSGRSKGLITALKAQNLELDISRLKLAGNNREASQLQDAQNRLGKVYESNEKFIRGYIDGHIDSKKALTAEQQGLVEFINKSGQAYDAQKQLADGLKRIKTEARDARAFDRYSEQWDKTLEKVEARGATSLERLRIQQEGEIRNVELKAQRAKATEEELGRALNAISVKYARLRQEEADKFAPGRAIENDYLEAQRTLEQIAQSGMLKDAELAQARLQIEGDYLKAKTQMRVDNAVSEQDMMRSVYDPVLAAQVEYETQLAQLEAYQDAHLISEENFATKKHELYTKLLKDQTVAQNSVVLSYLDSAATIGDSLATILDAAGAKGSTAYRAMFALSKAFSIAQASLNLTTAISQALADPTALTPAQKFANMAAVAAAGASLVTQVTSVGMAHDGIDNIPKEGTWLLDKGERVVDRRTNQDLKDFLNGGNGGGSTIVYLTQNIQMSGSGDAALQAAMRQAAAEGAEGGFQKVLADTGNNGLIFQNVRS